MNINECVSDAYFAKEIFTGSMAFVPCGRFDNSNEIDGTPGCPQVQVQGPIFRCTPAMSKYVAHLANAQERHAYFDPHYMQANERTQPTLIALFDDNQPDVDYEFLTFKKGLKTDAWYCCAISF